MTDLLDRETAMRIVVLGRQGSGKGEQCTRLARRLALEHISTGELLRESSRDGTPLGRASETYVVRGEPVPDDLVAGIVAERLAVAAVAGRGVLLDGYPRSVAQAERLAELMHPARVDLAIHLDVPRSIAVERIQNRRVCLGCHATGTQQRCPVCGSPTTRRADDWPTAIGRRMSDHAREMGPLLDWFEAQGVLETVDGRADPDSVAELVNGVVDRRMTTPIRR